MNSQVMIARTICAGAAVLIVVGAHGQITQNHIYQYNDDLLPETHYHIDQPTATIDIIAGIANPASRFRFEARTEQWNGSAWVDIGLGDIEIIKIRDGVGDPGTVRIEVNGNGTLNHVHGARHLREIRLPTARTAGSHLWWIRVSGDLGKSGGGGLGDHDSVGLVQGVVARARNGASRDAPYGWIYA